MTMARGVTEIDRLIEQGLGLYGEGDLDGALLLWERVLVIDPENAQANSYVDYVRMNYELLTGDGNTEDSGPFGIGNDDPDYQIEILPGEGVEAALPAPLYMDARDEGWVIGDEAESRTQESVLLELEADEPPLSVDPAAFENTKTGESVSFEANTREYPGGAGRPTSVLITDSQLPAAQADFNPEDTPAFGSPSDVQTPQGFGSQVTDVRRRDLGFVHPTEPERRVAPGPPELKMTLRTPATQRLTVPPIESDRHRAPTAQGGFDDGDNETTEGRRERTLDLEGPTLDSTGDSDSASAYASLDLVESGPPDPTADRDLVARADTRPAMIGADAADDDLISSLPTPRPPTATTRPLPSKTRPPALNAQSEHERPTRDLATHPVSGTTGAPPAHGVGMAQTQELPFMTPLDPALQIRPDPQLSALTRDFSEKPTAKITDFGETTATKIADFSAKPTANIADFAEKTTTKLVVPGTRPDDPLISAPTRELGLRTERRPSTEDEPTAEVDVHKVRTVRSNGKPEISPMDAIDARSAEILEEIDRNAPDSESREDRTRRRITALLDRATGWGREHDLERAVTAADLALSEDPNSALAQKLIHRNRETIMNAFQGFLGDLQRSLVLARPLHELGSAPISPRAAFLLSRVDGTLSLDEILDVSGMPRLEAYRYLCQLLLRGILR